jgi:hypothetical protein
MLEAPSAIRIFVAYIPIVLLSDGRVHPTYKTSYIMSKGSLRRVSNVKDKCIRVRVVKAYGNVEVWLHSFLNTAQNGRGQLHTPPVVPQCNSLRCPLNRNWPERLSRSGHCGKEKNPFPLSI